MVGENKDLITRIDDISGEHGRYIKHATHKHGTDIDMYHFYRFPGATSGRSNHQKLIDNVLLAKNTESSDPDEKAKAEAAQTRVIAWIEASRSGLDKLASNDVVATLYYVDGEASSGSGLSGHWASKLLKTGKVTISGKEIDFETGEWNNDKYKPDNKQGHNNHVHITLNRAKLGEKD